MPRTESHGEGSLTMAGEDYIESIYRLMESGSGNVDDGVRSVDVADDLNVSKASVSKALTYLKDRGMVEQSRYGRVKLTTEGAEYARDVWRRHRALRLFLMVELGVEEQIADDEACHIEHVVSVDTMNRLYRYLEERGVLVEN